jgi:hypothetical protein
MKHGSETEHVAPLVRNVSSESFGAGILDADLAVYRFLEGRR